MSISLRVWECIFVIQVGFAQTAAATMQLHILQCVPCITETFVRFHSSFLGLLRATILTNMSLTVDHNSDDCSQFGALVVYFWLGLMVRTLQGHYSSPIHLVALS